MDSAESVAAKRQVLVDALMMCLGKSRVCQVIDRETVRGVLTSASGELWREGEFRLESVWKMLIAQPGLSAAEVAPPLLVFKAWEKELGVQVRVPQALSAIPRGEQIRLRDQLGVQRVDFQRAIDEMRTLADEQRQSSANLAVVAAAEAAEAGDEPTPVGREPAAPPQQHHHQHQHQHQHPHQHQQQQQQATAKRSLGLWSALAVVGLIAAGLSVWAALRDNSKTFDLNDVAPTLQLANGITAGGALTATIVDARWGEMSVEQRKGAVSTVLDFEEAKGIMTLTLLDKNGNSRAIAGESPNGRFITVQ